jgi:Xaa-Pro aminopeptidase
VQQVIADYLISQGLTFDHPAIVAVNANSGNPHYAPSSDGGAAMREGDFVLIDLWAKLNQPRAVMSDLTRVGFIGSDVPQRYEDVFQIVARARDAAIAFVRDAFANEQTICGWQVDDAARHVIEQAGYGAYFIHRTGHSLGQETHGNGANVDNLETHDERRVLRRTCFTIEPGIYLPEFGVRSEVNVFVDATGQAHVTGGELQKRVVPILAE